MRGEQERVRAACVCVSRWGRRGKWRHVGNARLKMEGATRWQNLPAESPQA